MTKLIMTNEQPDELVVFSADIADSIEVSEYIETIIREDP